MPDPLAASAARLAADLAAYNRASEKTRQLIADLRAEREMGRALLAEVRDLLTDSGPVIVEKALGPAINLMSEQIGARMREAVERVDQQIEGYLELSLGQDAYSRIKGRQSIPDLIAEARVEGGP
jgi:Arc/MetJ-type ribon-helix-helix transcriptional regulator